MRGGEESDTTVSTYDIVICRSLDLAARRLGDIVEMALKHGT